MQVAQCKHGEQGGGGGGISRYLSTYQISYLFCRKRLSCKKRAVRNEKDHFLSDKDERAERSGALCYTGQTETGVSGWLHEDYATDNEHFFFGGVRYHDALTLNWITLVVYEPPKKTTTTTPRWGVKEECWSHMIDHRCHQPSLPALFGNLGGAQKI